MKKVLVMTSLVFSSVLHSIAVEAGTAGNKSSATEKTTGKSGDMKIGEASGNKSASVVSARQRANNLTEQMVKELKLNNYQTRKLFAINLDKINRMMSIEANGGDPNAIDNDCKGVCKERDRELENILSTEQYSDYFSKRPDYYKLDKQYAFGGNLDNTTATINTGNSSSDAGENTVASK